MVNQRVSLRDIDISLNGKIVGGSEELTANISREGTPAGQGGTYQTVEIVEGMEKIEGTLITAYLNVELINELFPNQAVLPEFTLSGSVNNDKSPQRIMKLFKVKFLGVELSDTSYESPYIKLSMPFMAVSRSFE